jgi:hydrogenase/urease accessory protein HupE
MRRSVPTQLLFLAACLGAGFSQPAAAHLVSTRFGEFYSGLLHPLTTMMHVVPWVAMALLAAVQGRVDARRNVLLFPLAVAVGVVIGALLPGFSAPTAVNLASLVALGALLAMARPLAPRVFYGLSLLVGVSHGYANSVVDLGAWDFTLYLAGVATSAYLLIVLLGAGSLGLLRHAWGLIAVRAAGSWILASGLLYAAFTVVGPQGA